MFEDSLGVEPANNASDSNFEDGEGDRGVQHPCDHRADYVLLCVSKVVDSNPSRDTIPNLTANRQKDCWTG